jgi:uncharacterized membrane protein
MAAVMGGAGVTHFVSPGFYEPIVPRPLDRNARFWVYASGVVELTCAVLLLRRRTRRLGGWLTVAALLGVYPANIQAALDGGMKEAKPPMDSPAAAWLRLPLQFPMILAALRIARTKRTAAEEVPASRR